MKYDEELTEKEIKIIDKFIDIILKNKIKLINEKELNKVLLSWFLLTYF